ncbi:MAG: aspartyl/asparaginyl beta-hydroxylase domain-containing protein [Caulobacteraceae bacterium]
MTPTADDLVRRAKQAERAGRPDEAALVWGELAHRFPSHPQALCIEGKRRIERGDAAGAIAVLAQAEQGDRNDAEIPLFASLAHKLQGAHEEALAAIERALAIEPYFFAALLSKGAMLEKLNRRKLAAQVYRDAATIAPPPEHMTGALRSQFEHGQALVAENARALAEHLRWRTADARARISGREAARFDECLELLAGTKRRFVHDPLLLYYPHLPADYFYDRELFPWLPTLEAAAQTIREELAVVLREDQAEFAPYIQKPAGAPLNQWAELNFSPAWSTFFLWKDGLRKDTNCARCPRTAELLESLPLCRQPGYGPTAMFSVLAPKTTIPAHTGSSNARLIVHLPLILPDNCRFRVGNETREWRMGEAWVFDDSIEHEAWNNSEHPRTILILDVWNPLLTKAERELVTEMMTALNEFSSGA